MSTSTATGAQSGKRSASEASTAVSDLTGNAAASALLTFSFRGFVAGRASPGLIHRGQGLVRTSHCFGAWWGGRLHYGLLEPLPNAEHPAPSRRRSDGQHVWFLRTRSAAPPAPTCSGTGGLGVDRPVFLRHLAAGVRDRPHAR